MRRTVLVLLLAGVAGRVFGGARAVVSDVQVIERAPDAFVVQTRSTAPQPFDLLPAGRSRTVAVRLHGANLARLAPVGRMPFGRVKLRARSTGDVLLRIKLRKGWTATAGQGGSAAVVVLRIGRSAR